MYHNPVPLFVNAAPFEKHDIIGDDAAFQKWISDPVTTQVVSTNDFIVHIDKVVYSTFGIAPITTIDKEMLPNNTLFGVNSEWTDRVTRSLKF